MVPDNRRSPQLDSGHSKKIGGMWNFKHDTSSPKFYELLIETKLKGCNAPGLNNFYNHINMCLNAVTRLREDLLPDYQYIKIHSEFEEYFIPDSDHPSYSWNIHIYTSLGHSLLVAMTNDTYVKSSMAPQAYKVFSNHAHEISVWTIISRLLHSCAPNIGGMNGDVQYDLSTLAFKNGEKLEYFHRIILRLQQQIILFGETLSPTRLLFHYMQAFSKSNKLKAFIAPDMTNIIIFLDKNGKYAVYTG